METNIVNEAFFWKHLADTLLAHSKIDKKNFYSRIEKIKEIWDLQDISTLKEQLEFAAKDKTNYIKKNFSKIITELNA